ncbi:MAG: tetratricopeptide repeat protein [Helicobacteraceae bacterium]|jgi:tetratricopeptide (TPR) repeat protein|nr:tetratricopeptide repeat protein [Helicobacteraceae bacterium]
MRCLIAIFCGFLLFACVAPSAYEQGLEARKSGKFQEAIEQFSNAIKEDPNNVEAYIRRGRSYANIKDYSRAIADFNQAIRIDSSNANAYHSRGNSYYRLGDTNKAIADWTQVIALDPTNAKAYSNRSTAYAKQKNYKNATLDAKKACDLGDCETFIDLSDSKLLVE